MSTITESSSSFSLSNYGMVYWKMCVNVSKVLQEANAYIYGGFVRDYILHDYNAEKFYEKYKYQDHSDIYKKYNDSSILPEYIDRKIYINDIDCYMKEEDFNNIIEIFNKNSFTCDIRDTKPAKFYFEDQTKSLYGYTQSKLLIKFKVPEALHAIVDQYKYYVKVDVIYSHYTIPIMHKEITKHIDFECNSLVLDTDNSFKLSYYNNDNELRPMEKMNKIYGIIDDIKNKKAKLLITNLNAVSDFRIKKMIEKNFKICTKNFEIYNNDENNNDICIICREDIKSKHIKDIDCDARFCFKCYNELINNSNYNNKCPQCNKCRYFVQREKQLIQTLSSSRNNTLATVIFNEIFVETLRNITI